MSKLKLKVDSDENADGGAASGTGLPVQIESEPVAALAVDVARALVAIARNGGGAATVALPDIVTSATTIKLREGGLIDVLSNVGTERARVKLTTLGVSRLIEAQKIVASVQAMSR